MKETRHTPSPTDIGGESTAEDGSGDSSHLSHTHHNTKILGSLVQRHRGRQDRQTAIHEARGAYTGDSSSDNEHIRRRSHTTDQGTQFENGEADEVDVLFQSVNFLESESNRKYKRGFSLWSGSWNTLFQRAAGARHMPVDTQFHTNRHPPEN